MSSKDEASSNLVKSSSERVSPRKCCSIVCELLRPPQKPQHINRLYCGHCVSQWLSAKLTFEGRCWGRRLVVLFDAIPDRKIIIFPRGTDCEKGFLSSRGCWQGISGCFWPGSPDSARSHHHEWVCDDVQEGQCPELMWWNQARVPPRAVSMTDRAQHHLPARFWSELTVSSITLLTLLVFLYSCAL